MKKILIVNNNMKIGGVQKSLQNLLWAIHEDYEITLLLFHKSGKLLDDLPNNIKITECRSLYRFFGISQGECSGFDKLKRGVLAVLGRKFGRAFALKFIRPTQKKIPEVYDAAIAFLHNGNPYHFYGGVQDFVLRNVKAGKKIAFLHCDYRLSDADHRINNDVIRKFDRIAACSEGCRNAFCEVVPDLAEKCVVVRNCHRFDRILALAGAGVKYPEGKFHILSVARLAHEKGIERSIAAMKYLKDKGIDACLHILGAGPMEPMLREMAEDLPVIFHGEQENPYQYMKNADLLLLTSFHEAAPMVIEEAAALALPVLTTRTTSAQEMVTQADCGFVCDNSQEAIERTVYKILSEPTVTEALKARMRGRTLDNGAALRQFQQMLED